MYGPKKGPDSSLPCILAPASLLIHKSEHRPVTPTEGLASITVTLWAPLARHVIRFRLMRDQSIAVSFSGDTARLHHLQSRSGDRIVKRLETDVAYRTGFETRKNATLCNDFW